MTLPDQQMSEEENPQLLKLTRQEYDDLDAERSSDFKVFMESPQKYEDVILNREYPRKETDSMRKGTVLHQFFLEKKTREGEDYGVWTKSSRRSNDPDWIEFQEDCESRGIPYVIRNNQTDELELIRLQVRAIQRCKDAMSLVERTAVREQAIVWNQDGVRCKALLDMLLEDGPIADLKTSNDPGEKKFFWSMDDYGYHYSAKWYELARDAYWQSDREYPFYWIVVANTGWIHCRVWEMPSELREIAVFHIKSKLQHFKHCRETGNWTDHEMGKSQMLHATNYYLEQNGIDLINGGEDV